MSNTYVKQESLKAKIDRQNDEKVLIQIQGRAAREFAANVSREQRKQSRHLQNS